MCHSYSVLLRMGFTLPPDLHPVRCALTAPFHPYLEYRGGLFSVALSLSLRSPDVIRHPALPEPGLSSSRNLQPPGPLPVKYSNRAQEVNSEQSFKRILTLSIFVILSHREY